MNQNKIINNEIINAFMGNSAAVRPCLTLTRPNMKCTGAAVRIELHPARSGIDGHLMLTVAAQTSLPERDENGMMTAARFDWDGAISVRLRLDDIAHFLEVMRGIEESIMNGEGLHHCTEKGNAVIRFSHQIEPHPGYMLEIVRRDAATGEEKMRYYFFSGAEILALLVAIENSLGVIALGVPSEL